MPLEIVRNDITKMQVDAIVNTANQHPIVGGGVDRAIYKAAGAELLEERKKIGDIATGKAEITSAYNLHAKFVIHTVGPVWQGGKQRERELLADCYANSLKLAVENDCSSVAFPLISAGVFGCPSEIAIAVATQAIREFLADHDMDVYLVVFDRKAFKICAIVGDIVGSVYEWNNIKTKDFPLFRDDCFFTDDTVMTCAVAEAVMNGGERENFIDAMKKYGRMYPDAGYGTRFHGWLNSSGTKPYNSYGNGSAMRVSPCAWVMDCGFCARTGMWPSNGRERAMLSAEVTHNHPEGIKGAMATADAIFMCRYYFGGYYGDYEKPINNDPTECKRRIKEHIEKEYGYDLNRTLDMIRPVYKFNETCQDTVPEAIIAFLESTDFEDAIRNAISIGGDSDTLAAITGSIAEAAYGIPDWIKEKAYSYLDEPLKDVLRRWRKFIAENDRRPFDKMMAEINDYLRNK